MKDIELNDDFNRAYDIAENTKRHIFITGKAGTGKSTFLKYFRDNTNKNIAVIAPTGVAAVNINGQTIHSFFGFRPDITVEKVKSKYKNIRKAKLYRALDALVIDEISMVRADLLDCVNEFLKMHGPNKGKTFGGIQMILIGDLYQLPPVVTSKEKNIFSQVYKSPYFFDSFAFSNFEFEIVELTKIYRQDDETFINILNSIRNKSIEDDLLTLLNKRFNESFEAPRDELYIYLTTTNKKADKINTKRLDEIDSKEYVYEAEIYGDFEEKYAPAPVILSLKKGAQIMLTNNDKNGRYINGTVGKIVDIEEDGDSDDVLIIELAEGGEIEVGTHTWEMYKFNYNEKLGKIESETVGSFTQYPVILAWAVTIHKAQGKTFDKAIVDMDRGAFTYGQTYVALSRCINLDGLVLKKKIEKRHIMSDWRVSKFLTEFAYAKSETELSLDGKTKIIESAIKNNSKLEIVYLKANNTKSKRVVEPFEIGDMEYLDKPFFGFSGMDELRGEERVFRVDRILEIKTL